MITKAFACLLLIGAADAACANDIFGRPEYAPLSLARSVGYHDHARDDGSWSIEARSSRMQREGYAGEMALYRAAELATQQGHRYFQLLRSEALVGTGMINRGDENVSLIVRFADDDATPAHCLQRGRHPGPCYTAEASRVIARLEPRIRDASWRRDQAEVAQAPASVTDHSGLIRVSTLFRFDLTEQGVVENCTLVESDAPPALNASACGIFGRMARLRPERDAAGKPVRATRTVRVVWQQSDLGGPTTMLPLADATPSPYAARPTVEAAAKPPAPKPIAPPRRAFPKDDAIEVEL